MRVLVLHSSQQKMVEWAKSLQGALQNEKCHVDLVSATASSGTPLSTASYNLVVVLSPFRGLLRPIIPIEIDNLIKRCTRLQGRNGVALVANRFGAGKAVRFLMQLLEVQGVMVQDFAVIRSPKDFPKLAERLAKIGS